ncbi:MAG: DUF4270 family protein [Muribaculaceae bacterium]|nr:DUF4270 family protein [Muribaculaceae bacterium]
MKFKIKLLLIVITIFGLYSCTDDTIGSSLIDTRNAIIEDSSFVITGHSVENMRLQARTSTQLLGLIKSNGYGTLSSQVVTQFMPANSIDTMGVTEDLIDSCKLVLRIANGGFTGNELVPMRMSVYRLNKQLESPLFSDFDPSGYYDPEDLMGETPYSPQSATIVYLSTQSTQSYLETYVPMDVEFARELFREFKNNPQTFNSPSNFQKFFPGMFITNSFGSGRMMNFDYTELQVFYRKKLTTLDGNDSISSTNSRTYMAATPEVLSNNILKLDVDPTVKTMIDNGDAIVMAPGGYEVKVKFPIQDIINSFNANTSGDLAVINKLSLSIPIENINTEYDINPPKYLLMVKSSMKDQFIEGDSLTNNKDSFYAEYNSENKCYTFDGLRDYVLNIINNKGGIAEADDIDLTITPVDVTTYTTQSTYYTTSSTIVTKISPQVSVPAITKLRLDKAKVKITYSKQSVL